MTHLFGPLVSYATRQLGISVGYQGVQVALGATTRTTTVNANAVLALGAIAGATVVGAKYLDKNKLSVPEKTQEMFSDTRGRFYYERGRRIYLPQQS